MGLFGNIRKGLKGLEEFVTQPDLYGVGERIKDYGVISERQTDSSLIQLSAFIAEKKEKKFLILNIKKEKKDSDYQTNIFFEKANMEKALKVFDEALKLL